MYDPDSIEDEPPILRDVTQLRNVSRIGRWRDRTRAPTANQLLTLPELADTHECYVCRASLYIAHNESAELHCIACNDYRLYTPLAYSPMRRWCAVTAYKLRNAWRSIKREVMR